MKAFKEIYNKRRSRDIGNKYTEDENGDYVCIADNTYINKNDITNEYHIKRKNGYFYNNALKVKAGEIGIVGGNEIITPKIEYYKKSEGKIIRDTNIVGTALAFTSTLWEYVITNNKLWNWFVGIVTDGYFMIFFSPFILAYWALLIVAYIPMIIILSALVIVAAIWTPILEFPAGYMNKEENQFFKRTTV